MPPVAAGVVAAAPPPTVGLEVGFTTAGCFPGPLVVAPTAGVTLAWPVLLPPACAGCFTTDLVAVGLLLCDVLGFDVVPTAGVSDDGFDVAELAVLVEAVVSLVPGFGTGVDGLDDDAVVALFVSVGFSFLCCV